MTLLADDSKANTLLTLQQAIQYRQVVQFKSDEHWRMLAPYKVGYLESDPQLLVVYGYSQDVVSSPNTPSRWQLFILKQMHQLSLTTYSFDILYDYEEPAPRFDSWLGPLLWLPHGLKPLPKRPRR